jgi:hypothetical protein
MDPDPYWESGSRGKKIKKFQWKTCTLVIFFLILPLKKYYYFLKKIWMNNTGSGLSKNAGSVSVLSESASTTLAYSVADPGCFIPDPDPTIAPSRIRIPDPGGKKSTGSRIRGVKKLRIADPDPQQWCHWHR